MRKYSAAQYMPPPTARLAKQSGGKVRALWIKCPVLTAATLGNDSVGFMLGLQSSSPRPVIRLFCGL